MILGLLVFQSFTHPNLNPKLNTEENESHVKNIYIIIIIFKIQAVGDQVTFKDRIPHVVCVLIIIFLFLFIKELM